MKSRRHGKNQNKTDRPESRIRQNTMTRQEYGERHVDEKTKANKTN